MDSDSDRALCISKDAGVAAFLPFVSTVSLLRAHLPQLRKRSEDALAALSSTAAPAAPARGTDSFLGLPVCIGVTLCARGWGQVMLCS